LIVPLR